MGSSGSKECAGAGAGDASSSRGAGVRRTRSRGIHSSCLGLRSYESDNRSDLLEGKEEEHLTTNKRRSKHSESLSCDDQPEEDAEDSQNDIDEQQVMKRQPHQEDAKVDSTCFRRRDNDDINQFSSSLSTSTSTSTSTSSRLDGGRGSRFSFIPANLRFRLSRAASFGSFSRPYALFTNTALTANTSSATDSAVIGNQALCGAGVNHSPAPLYVSDALTLDPHTSAPRSPHGPSDDIAPSQDYNGSAIVDDMPLNNQNTGILPDIDHHTSSNVNTELEFVQSRHVNRDRIGAREPVERSVRFSRTLSVGRLRDRVLRRSSFPEGLFGRLQQDRQVDDFGQDNGEQLRGGGNADTLPQLSSHPLSTMSNSLYNSQYGEMESSGPREAGYHDIMEHRTDFLERRRRIRSQVRALQRLGSRFENLSGHERSCILAGQHRSGRCTCRTSGRTRNPDDDTSARASISRIVMLAEALFEVLDEIHQQSVLLSSRPSVPTLGSIPAPKEVVESMPMKIYSKLHKHQVEDVQQCYICLVEYEEGDCMRILPCHHEFHRTCIDKWLKEIHRVCPLCRGDVCRSDSLN